MLYDIGLRIRYDYQTPAAGGRHVLCMTPADMAGQRPITSLLEMTPAPDERIARTDFFGNTLVEVAFRAPHAEIEFRLRARVERHAASRREDVSTPLTHLPAAIAAIAIAGIATRRITFSPTVHACGRRRSSGPMRWSRSSRTTMTTLQAVETIGRAIDRDMTFEPGSTQVDTPPEEAFARRRGVCQDFTPHHDRLPARASACRRPMSAASCGPNPPEGQPRLEGADAMHAWVRAWCGPQTGWVEYDPTNGVRVGDQHIVVAYGRDYGDVAPVRGVVRIAGAQKSSQAVDVVPLKGKDGA